VAGELLGEVGVELEEEDEHGGADFAAGEGGGGGVGGGEPGLWGLLDGGS
jgi:hypothetical protein